MKTQVVLTEDVNVGDFYIFDYLKGKHAPAQIKEIKTEIPFVRTFIFNNYVPAIDSDKVTEKFGRAITIKKRK